MTEHKICTNCRQPFSIKRNFANRHADIRFCDNCKDDLAYIRQHERTAIAVSTRPGGRKMHLASN